MTSVHVSQIYDVGKHHSLIPSTHSPSPSLSSIYLSIMTQHILLGLQYLFSDAVEEDKCESCGVLTRIGYYGVPGGAVVWAKAARCLTCIQARKVPRTFAFPVQVTKCVNPDCLVDCLHIVGDGVLGLEDCTETIQCQCGTVPDKYGVFHETEERLIVDDGTIVYYGSEFTITSPEDECFMFHA